MVFGDESPDACQTLFVSDDGNSILFAAEDSGPKGVADNAEAMIRIDRTLHKVALVAVLPTYDGGTRVFADESKTIQITERTSLIIAPWGAYYLNPNARLEVELAGESQTLTVHHVKACPPNKRSG